MIISKYIYKFIVVIILTIVSCKNEKIDNTSNDIITKEYTVAVILPMENGLNTHWERILGFINKNMEIAQRNLTQKVQIYYEIYDENKTDIKALAYKLGEREDITAVIGCMYSDDASIVSNILAKYQKTLFTISTSSELVRANAKDGYLWAITETDITQCEALLTKAESYGAKSVALISKENSSYCQTFIDWFSFQAQELGLEVKGLFIYNDNNIKETTFNACNSNSDYLICVPANSTDVGYIYNFINQHSTENEYTPKSLFSDVAYGENVINKFKSEIEGLEGISYTANPETGFEVSYYTYFNDYLSKGEAQIYDSCMLLYYSLYYINLYKENNLDLKSAIRAVVNGRDENQYGWMGEDMENVFEAFNKGEHPNINGASGSLDFDKEVYTNVLSTTYTNFTVYNNKYLRLGYITSNGSNRTESTLAGWNWRKTQIQDFDENQKDIEYPLLKDKWALLIASSKGWDNYRHQADVLSIYSMLRKNGYPDDRIILIMEDDIAYNNKNTEQGVVKTDPHGENLYTNPEIDYKVSELTPSDVMDIMEGNENDKLNKVIKSTSNDNILVFWSGHGTQNELVWGDLFMGVRKDMIKNSLYNMGVKRNYRKMLFLTEACYSGSIMNENDIPGALFITAANENETSKADNYNSTLGVWMSNKFTYGIREQLNEDMYVSIREMYYKIFINTVGSHVMVYNTENFGNIYQNSIAEFFLY